MSYHAHHGSGMYMYVVSKGFNYHSLFPLLFFFLSGTILSVTDPWFNNPVITVAI